MCPPGPAGRGGSGARRGRGGARLETVTVPMEQLATMNVPLEKTSGTMIVLEGLDGTGKSTQCRLLADWLRTQGHSVTTCVDPGGTPLGSVIRRLLLDRQQLISLTCEMFLFMAS